MKKLIASLIFCFVLVTSGHADEGMWMLPYLEKLNITDMRNAGARLTAKEIYDADGSSIKDAIVHFGGGCTGEIVSPEGLLFTNHHCGYSWIQDVSSMESDYLKNGFWAMQRAEEIHCPGLTVKFVRHIIDVTDKVQTAMDGDPSAARHDVTNRIIKEYEAQYPDMQVSIAQMFGGNQFVLFVNEIYRDIRLVGAPPTSIGKFGGETDNWMWPRHTGDFSVFRIYAGKDGRPADYSRENVPLATPKFLEISGKGYEEGDFAMIIGFPGSTQRYMTSFELDKRVAENYARVFVRGVRQDVLKERMNMSDKIRLQYAAKYASSSNYWKNSIGMNAALAKHGVKAEKEAFEKKFQAWADKPGNEQYKNVLNDIRESIYPIIPAATTQLILAEAINRGIEIINFAGSIDAVHKAKDLAEREKLIESNRKRFETFYKNFDLKTDRLAALAMLGIIADSLSPQDRPSFFETEIEGRFGGDIAKYLDYLYSTSVFRSAESFAQFLESGSPDSIYNQDPATVAYNSWSERNLQLSKEIRERQTRLAEAQRLLIKGTLAMNPDVKYYPDANSSIRFTYGNILSYSPRDAVQYNYLATLTGVMEKENPEVYEFIVPQRLKELYETQNFGSWAHNGNIPVCFISTNDITGGNSGSPVLDAHGRLIGIAFDGNWEALSGDIMFDPEMQRCINVDVRYVLFVIDKFAGSPIINELRIVR